MHNLKITKIFKLAVLFSIVFSLLFSNLQFLSNPQSVFAQSNVDKAEKELNAQLKILLEEERILEESLNQQKGKTATIERDVNILTDEIKKAQLKIQQKSLEIKNLSSSISVKEQKISELDQKIDRGISDLSILIKKSNKADMISLPEIILSNKSLSEFFIELYQYKSAQRQLEVLFQEIREIQGLTEGEKSKLEQAQNKEVDAKYVIERERENVQVKKVQQDSLLATSKKSEATYESILAERRAQAASIRNTLFQLRDSGGIRFEDILNYAEIASKATGVRTALILGILKQETDLGKVDGSCLIVDLTSGKTKGINTGNIFVDGIHPTRDLPIIQNLLGKLGRNPLETRISCPWGNGYGGALGPSQFIPSTWVLYIPKLTEIFKTYPDPWNPQHAVMGTALLMKDNGASAGGYTAEKNAACKYYSGAVCTPGRVPANTFYGDSVMAHAADMQKQINFLKDVAND